mgnify:FL=1
MGEKYAVWFTEDLGAETRLRYSHPEIDLQIVNPKYIYNKVNYHPKTKITHMDSRISVENFKK